MGLFTENVLVRKTVKCEGCPLNTQTKVWGTGSYNGGIIFLGEAPGEKEDLQGEPFVGKSGKILNRALSEIGLNRYDNWLTNVINCRPPSNNFNSVEAQTALKRHCNRGLYEELDFLREKSYKVVVPLGKNACNALDLFGTMGELRGTLHEFYKFIVVPTYHPSYILRKGGVGTVEWYYWLEDLKNARSEYLLDVI